eukprot:CAMPEP_0170489658 /NCGR_PEP_ID=MMETSP0208-20121228/7972_1 /TAXON_ID=197538 /ORGANISM="Strombidium inclinatum, Strain S3" /LENGTH=187 /DNA_ID=CAMNT_0010764665 /DNA_START=21 /DNA_END=581 /DNA_ORIENTATION=+
MTDGHAEVIALIRELLELELKAVSCSDLSANLLLRLVHLALRHLRPLLEINYQFIRPLNLYFVLFDFTLVHRDLVVLLDPHRVQKVVQALQLDVEVGDLGVFQKYELLQLGNFFFGILFLSFELVHHSKERPHVFTACLFEILNNFFSHGHLLLVVLELHCELLGVVQEPSEVLVLELLSLIDFEDI